MTETHSASGSDFGVLYLADDNPAYRRMLDISIQSLRRFHPDWPVHVVDVPSPPVGMARRTYRLISFWKAAKRRARAGQDVRVIADKMDAMLGSPYQQTLYLDVDTVVMRPLDGLRHRASRGDVLATPLPWKTYARLEPWQPESWPYMMAGVLFFGERFKHVYSGYRGRCDGPLSSLPTQDQFVFSLACHNERGSLTITEAPSLQVDVLNVDQHLGVAVKRDRNGCIDIRETGLKGFHVFHYNDQKPEYMKQIEAVWGLS